MDLRKQIATKNACYIAGVKIKPIGIMVHSTGANNPNLRRYVPVPGEPVNTNNWDNFHPGGKVMGPHKFEKGSNGKCKTCGGTQVCVHGFIGKLKDGSIATYQTLPWDMKGWHSGVGKKSSANNLGYIGFEICEDDLSSKDYFDKVYKEAVELCIYLCKEFDLTEKDIITHCEGYKMGIASNHGDVMHWFPKYGKSMDTFRAAVKEGLESKEEKEGVVTLTMTVEELNKLIDDRIRIYGVGQPISTWAEGQVKEAVELGITDGSNPQRLATRQEVMIMAKRAAEINKG